MTHRPLPLTDPRPPRPQAPRRAPSGGVSPDPSPRPSRGRQPSPCPHRKNGSSSKQRPRPPNMAAAPAGLSPAGPASPSRRRPPPHVTPPGAAIGRGEQGGAARAPPLPWQPAAPRVPAPEGSRPGGERRSARGGSPTLSPGSRSPGLSLPVGSSRRAGPASSPAPVRRVGAVSAAQAAIPTLAINKRKKIKYFFQ